MDEAEVGIVAIGLVAPGDAVADDLEALVASLGGQIAGEGAGLLADAAADVEDAVLSAQPGAVDQEVAHERLPVVAELLGARRSVEEQCVGGDEVGVGDRRSFLGRGHQGGLSRVKVASVAVTAGRGSVQRNPCRKLGW